MTELTATTITERTLAEKLRVEASEGYTTGDGKWRGIARKAAEELGVELAPEPTPLPTEPGSIIIATEVRGVTGEWRAFLEPDGIWATPERVDGHIWHRPAQITAWTEARIVPGTAAPVTLTEDQVGELWGKESVPLVAWSVLGGRNRERITATVNAALAKYAAPAGGEPIDPGSVRGGDRVRLVMDNGDEVTFTVRTVAPGYIRSTRNVYDTSNIHSIHLLHRGDQP